MGEHGIFHCEELQEAALRAAGEGGGETYETFKAGDGPAQDRNDQWMIEHGLCPDCVRTFARIAERDMAETGATPGHVYLGAFVTAWALAMGAGFEPPQGEGAEELAGGWVHAETGETVRIISATPSKVLVAVQLSSAGDGEERERQYDRRYFDAHFVRGDQVQVIGGGG